MEIKLTMQERLKDLRVIDKRLTLEQLSEQEALSRIARKSPVVATVFRQCEKATIYQQKNRKRKAEEVDLCRIYESAQPVTVGRSCYFSMKLLSAVRGVFIPNFRSRKTIFK